MYNTDDLAQIESAILSVVSVTYGDHAVKYQDLRKTYKLRDRSMKKQAITHTYGYTDGPSDYCQYLFNSHTNYPMIWSSVIYVMKS